MWLQFLQHPDNASLSFLDTNLLLIKRHLFEIVSDTRRMSCVTVFKCTYQLLYMLSGLKGPLR